MLMTKLFGDSVKPGADPKVNLSEIWRHILLKCLLSQLEYLTVLLE